MDSSFHEITELEIDVSTSSISYDKVVITMSIDGDLVTIYSKNPTLPVVIHQDKAIIEFEVKA